MELSSHIYFIIIITILILGLTPQGKNFLAENSATQKELLESIDKSTYRVNRDTNQLVNINDLLTEARFDSEDFAQDKNIDDLEDYNNKIKANTAGIETDTEQIRGNILLIEGNISENNELLKDINSSNKILEKQTDKRRVQLYEINNSLNTSNSRIKEIKTTLKDQNTTIYSFRNDFQNEDFAQESTLSNIDSAQNTTNDKLTTLNNTVATENTLSTLKNDFQNEDFAQETTLSTVSSDLSTLKNDFQSEDFAQESTLANIDSAQNTTNDKLSTLNSNVATENTLSILKNDFQNEDFAQETTLSTVSSDLSTLKNDFQSEDFAQESTLQNVANETGQSDIRGHVSSIDNKISTSSTGRVQVETRSGIGQDVADGKAYAYGEEISVSAGSTGSWHLQNPSDSCVVVKLVKVEVNADTHAPVELRKDASTTASGSGNNPTNLDFGSTDSSNVTLISGTDALSGGDVVASPEVDPGDGYEFKGLAIIPPGHNASAMWQSGGLASETTPSLTANWVEAYQPQLPGC